MAGRRLTALVYETRPYDPLVFAAMQAQQLGGASSYLCVDEDSIPSGASKKRV
jgi:hypothetical protein